MGRPMTPETRYWYEKRLRELRDQVRNLEAYRTSCMNIYDNVCQHVQDNTHVNAHWILRQMKWLFR